MEAYMRRAHLSLVCARLQIRTLAVIHHLINGVLENASEKRHQDVRTCISQTILGTRHWVRALKPVSLSVIQFNTGTCCTWSARLAGRRPHMKVRFV